jgi:hypothetical protein
MSGDDPALDPVELKSLAAVERGDLDEKRGADDRAAGRLDQPDAGTRRAAGSENVGFYDPRDRSTRAKRLRDFDPVSAPDPDAIGGNGDGQRPDR